MSDDNKVDAFGKRILAPLHNVPALNPEEAHKAKELFLLKAESIRAQLSSSENRKRMNGGVRRAITERYQGHTLVRVFAAITLAILVLILGGGITAYAAQGSLPGEPLYTIKSWGEDLHLAMTFLTQSKLSLTLDYTNRRLEEIASLIAKGKKLNSHTSERYLQELDKALQLAVELDDTQLQSELARIKTQAENQGKQLEEIIAKLPPQADQAILQLQARLDEQVELTSFGEMNPNEFRVQIRDRWNVQHNQGHNGKTETPESSPASISDTPVPEQNGNGHGNKSGEATTMPGGNNKGNGKGQVTPGNGNHKPDDTQTAEP